LPRRDGATRPLFLPEAEAIYFFRTNWTGQITLRWLGNSAFTRTRIFQSNGRFSGDASFSNAGSRHRERMRSDRDPLEPMVQLNDKQFDERFFSVGVRAMARRNRNINLPAPYLKRIWLDSSRVADRKAYPFCLPFLNGDFELSFDRAVTIIVGENGTGKSTILEGIAALAGFDDAGGGRGHRPVDHSNAIEIMGGELSDALRASWLPKITNGWFFRAESFFSVARYLDEVNRELSLTFVAARRRISSLIPTAKVFCGSSRSAVNARASSSSTSRNRRCRRRVKSNF
jgi:hypothetical protein